MKLPWRSLALLVGAATAFSAQAARLGDAAEELVEKVHEAELGASVGKTKEARVSALQAFEGYLDGALQKLPQKNPDDDTRKLRASLWSFKSYVGKIDLQAFDPKDCAQYRAAIMLGFSPHDAAPKYVPGEARESLKLLSLLCQKPELAEIPGSTPEPPPAIKTR
jgi:hypothetical protein